MSELSLSEGWIVTLGLHFISGDCFQMNGMEPLSCTCEKKCSFPCCSANNTISVSAVFAEFPSKSHPRTIHRFPCLRLSRRVMIATSHEELVPTCVNLISIKPLMNPVIHSYALSLRKSSIQSELYMYSSRLLRKEYLEFTNCCSELVRSYSSEKYQ